MVSRLSGFVLNALVSKYALGHLVKIWRVATGHKTQISSVLAGVIVAAGVLGVIPLNDAINLASAVGGVAAASLMEKLKRHQALVESLQVKVSDAAKAAEESAKPVDAAILEISAAEKKALENIRDAGNS